MSERKLRIAAVGDNCMDVYDKEGMSFPGGNPVNVAVYTARLGGESTYIGAVGTDIYGEQMISAIASKGVDTSHIKVIDGTTAITHVEIVDGDRILGDYDEGVMETFTIDDNDIAFLAGYDVVVSGLWGKVEDKLKDLKAAGATVAFDFATRPDDPVSIIAIPYVDYGFFSDDESDEAELKEIMKGLWDKGPKVIVATRGEKGSIAYDGHDFYHEGIIECEIADTMGAGDSYIAGFLYAICEGKSIPEAMHAGAVNSSITLGYSGAW